MPKEGEYKNIFKSFSKEWFMKRGMIITHSLMPIMPAGM